MRALLRALLRNRYVMWLGKRLYTYFLDDIRQVLNENPAVNEINPLPIRRSEHPGLRINLMIPAVSERHIFGGISTALQFFESFAPHAPDLRIIATDEGSLRDERMDRDRFKGWTFADSTEPDQPGRLITAVGHRRGALPLRDNDVFIATAWWTAHLATALTRQQAEWHGGPRRRFIYLIQDYEPLFHPWSARYALAAQTYDHRNGYTPVFNTSLLRDYMAGLGLAAPDALSFDPTLNRRLKDTVQGLAPMPRERRILVYGRPSVDRNAYPLLVRGLRRLAERVDVSGWQFVSAGEPHAPADLGGGATLTALGKLSLEDYARELRRCHAGVSLMISPHPSYPPLEMAANGLWVVTNHYPPKDLSTWAPNIRSIDVADADQLADQLADIMGRFGEPVPDGALDPAFRHYLEGSPDFAAVADAAWEQAHA